MGRILVDLLKGIRIVSFTHFLFGVMGVQALTDLGTHVIAIDLQMETFICYLNGPQVRQNSCFVTIPGATGTPIMLVAHPIRYDGEAPHIRLPPQPLGAQTEEILKEAGYSDAEIADLEREGIVYCHHPGRPRQPSQKVKRKR